MLWWYQSHHRRLFGGNTITPDHVLALLAIGSSWEDWFEVTSWFNQAETEVVHPTNPSRSLNNITDQHGSIKRKSVSAACVGFSLLPHVIQPRQRIKIIKLLKMRLRNFMKNKLNNPSRQR